MILNSLKISNILSFELIQEFEKAKSTIDFKNDLNILIGSNGSGKSNLVEIINKLFQGHFFEYYYTDDNALFYKSEDKAIKINKERRDQVYNTIFKNFNTPNSPSRIQIEISPDKGDIDNLLNILANLDEFKKFSSQYCDHQLLLNAFNDISKADIRKITNAKYTFEVDNLQSTSKIKFTLISSSIEKKEISLFYSYLIYFNQIQTLIEVVNSYEKKNWPLLKNPFALISSMRQYGGFPNSFSVGTGLNNQIKSLDQNEGSVSAKHYGGTGYIFAITNLRLGQLFRKLIFESGIDRAYKTIENSENILTRINTLLKLNLGFVIKPDNHNIGNDSVMLQIYDNDKIINFEQLSMGQKSIFYLLFAVYGYNIENGLLIIDEPELHLHLSMQKKYFNLLKSICRKENIQIIIATHSSTFIDENTIKNTFRFFKTGNHTSIVNPSIISQTQKNLIKILNYTNSSRIFFSNKVILVEGDSDEYFFNYFYENYITKEIKSNETVEILYIGGKGNFSKFRDFLEIFKIDCFFICDFDNIKEFEIPNKIGIDLQELINKSKSHVISKFTKEKIDKKTTKDGLGLLTQIDSIIGKNFRLTKKDKEDLKSLWIYLIEKQGLKRTHIIEYLNEKEPSLCSKLKKEIDKLYQDKIFILKDGDLEDYLSLPKIKDLTNVIQFCQKDFNSWIEQEKAKGDSSKLAELKKIFEKILNSNESKF